MMSEFNQTSAPPEPIAQRPEAPRRKAAPWWSRELILGLSLPWIVGILLILAAGIWYLFGPAPTPKINALAFGDAADTSSRRSPAPASPSAPAAFEQFGQGASSSEPAGAGLTSIQDEVARMVGGMRSYEEATRTAVERLSETVKSQGVLMGKLQAQVSELQAVNAVLSGRLDTLGQRPGNTVAQPSARSYPSKPAPKISSPVADMHLSAIQNGMAWVRWQDKTWAVQVGDSLGSVRITGIDAPDRQVRTSAGTIQ